MSENREMLMQYLNNQDLISDEKVDLLLTLLTKPLHSKREILKVSGVDPEKMNFDTAYPQPYADKLREQYPDFNNGCYIYDYTENTSWGALVNIYNLFGKHILKTLALG